MPCRIQPCSRCFNAVDLQLIGLLLIGDFLNLVTNWVQLWPVRGRRCLGKLSWELSAAAVKYCIARAKCTVLLKDKIVIHNVYCLIIANIVDIVRFPTNIFRLYEEQLTFLSRRPTVRPCKHRPYYTVSHNKVYYHPATNYNWAHSMGP